jgi:hypothetical protein
MRRRPFARAIHAVQASRRSSNGETTVVSHGRGHRARYLVARAGGASLLRPEADRRAAAALRRTAATGDGEGAA